MLVLREHGLIDEIILTFRYKLTEQILFNELKEGLKKLNIPFKYFEPNDRIKTYRIIIDEIHSDYFKPNEIKKLNQKHNIGVNQYDFFIGITSRYDLGGFRVPSKVIDAICVLGGNVEFSYSCSSEE